MKLNNLYRKELRLIAEVREAIDRIPEGIVYTSIALIATIAIIISI